MHNQPISAFTIKAKKRANVLLSEVGVSANKELFKDAKEESFVAIWDTGATNTAISSKVAEKCGLIPTGRVKSNTANGEIIVNTYLIDVRLPNNVKINGVQATEFTAVEGSIYL